MPRIFGSKNTPLYVWQNLSDIIRPFAYYSSTNIISFDPYLERLSLIYSEDPKKLEKIANQMREITQNYLPIIRNTISEFMKPKQGLSEMFQDYQLIKDFVGETLTHLAECLEVVGITEYDKLNNISIIFDGAIDEWLEKLKNDYRNDRKIEMQEIENKHIDQYIQDPNSPEDEDRKIMDPKAIKEFWSGHGYANPPRSAQIQYHLLKSSHDKELEIYKENLTYPFKATSVEDMRKIYDNIDTFWNKNVRSNIAAPFPPTYISTLIVEFVNSFVYFPAPSFDTYLEKIHLLWMRKKPEILEKLASKFQSITQKYLPHIKSIINKFSQNKHTLSEILEDYQLAKDFVREVLMHLAECLELVGIKQYDNSNFISDTYNKGIDASLKRMKGRLKQYMKIEMENIEETFIDDYINNSGEEDKSIRNPETIKEFWQGHGYANLPRK